VRDETGRPVAGAAVEVWMKRHEFGFGTAVNASYLYDGTEDDNKRRYRAETKRLFNKAVLENALKWPASEGAWGGGQREKALKTIRWLRDEGLDVRGHCLVWPSWKNTPKNLQDLKGDPAALRRRVAERVTEAVAATRGTLVEWDVVNEPFTNHDLMDVLGWDVMIEWFKLARLADPGTKLYINDYSILAGGAGWSDHRQHYEGTLRMLVDGSAARRHRAAEPLRLRRDAARGSRRDPRPLREVVDDGAAPDRRTRALRGARLPGRLRPDRARAARP
jgi:endo-1,4-beta-xylanase